MDSFITIICYRNGIRILMNLVKHIITKIQMYPGG